MENKPKSLGRAYLVGKLRELGLSRRDAVRTLNFVFDEMTQALRRGEKVEFPFGTLLQVRHQHAKKRGWFLEKIITIYKRPYTVKHELDEEGYKLLNGKEGIGAGRLERQLRAQTVEERQIQHRVKCQTPMQAKSG